MAPSSSLVFVVVCLLHIASSAELSGVPDCSGLGEDALKTEKRSIVAERVAKAMKNLQSVEYWCALEKMAKFSVYIPGYNDQNRYDTVEFRQEE
ncbi:hypothetical protein ANCCAN_26637 [Ancylostoma caninum]|uniref:Uncharacterized protein n=1 Tax=Ancylostoma caninum TaxID=29170 RepID=A0A368F7S1_ANCCA|nr:hypothetical protein ANCCAN_26637 [Ancylostoma caninum]